MTKQNAKILRFIVNKESKTNQIYLCREDCKKIGMEEKDVVKGLFYLQEGNYIKMVKLSPQINLSIPCVIDICERGLDYEEQRAEERKKITWDTIKFLIPTIISIFALIFAI